MKTIAAAEFLQITHDGREGLAGAVLEEDGAWTEHDDLACDAWSIVRAVASDRRVADGAARNFGSRVLVSWNEDGRREVRVIE
jgi:hypothetical protein